MDVRAEAEGLWDENNPTLLWRLLEGVGQADDWAAAGGEARGCMAGLPAAWPEQGVWPSAVVLGEGQFGSRHWQMGLLKQAYYALRPFLPTVMRPLLQRAAARRGNHDDLLNWPVEDRYVRWQYETVRCLLARGKLASVPYIHFWPDGRRFAFVLTHDVDSAKGQGFVRQVTALEEQLGFRSSFNFVPEGYAVERCLLAELREHGFEVGVHGLKHDGKLFSSERTFQRRARRINDYLAAWQAVGFRSPMTHRNPAWMQALEIEYDSSFFDTDPFEPMPGGTMSVWPFFIGRFVELPYTLAQDHTLLRTLGETTPRLWLEKAEFIRQHCGMALLNTHPDYLLNPRYMAVYEQFLARMREQGEYWHALPMEVARWWRRRASAAAVWDGSRWATPDLPEAGIGRLGLDASGTLVVEPGPSAGDDGPEVGPGSRERAALAADRPGWEVMPR